MIKALPPEAFAYYVGLGAGRSHQAVADHFEVHKRTVLREAERSKWNARLEAIEQEAREATDAELKKDMTAMHLRHRKMLGAMASRSARALQEFPLTNGMEGIKAAMMVIKLERLLSGEPTSRPSLEVEQLIRLEHQQFMVVDEDDDGDESEDAEDLGEDDDDG
jgi:hypothetical protein